MKTRKYLTAALLVLVVLFCGIWESSSAAAENARALTPSDRIERFETLRQRLGHPREDGYILDHGNGVYYFAAIGENFRKLLSDFIYLEADLELVTISDDVIENKNGTASFTVGHTVVFKKK